MFFVNLATSKSELVRKDGFILKCPERDTPKEGWVGFAGNYLGREMLGKNPWMYGLVESDYESLRVDAASKARYPQGVYNPFGVSSKKPLSFTEVSDTANNPLIIVLCKSIEVYRGIDVDAKYIVIDDEHILFCLISGVARIDGIPMSRCCSSSIIDRKSKVLNASEFSTMAYCRDNATGYDYTNDAIVHIRISYGIDKLGGDFMGYKTSSNFTWVFNETNLNKAKERKKELDARRAELLKKREEKEKEKLESINKSWEGKEIPGTWSAKETTISTKSKSTRTPRTSKKTTKKVSNQRNEWTGAEFLKIMAQYNNNRG